MAMKVSNSQIQCFKSCRRMYQLKYIYGLEPVQVSDAIERGLSYHEAVEQILSGEQPDCDDPKVAAMAEMFRRKLGFLPIASVEDWFEYKTPNGHTVFGRFDAKTKSGIVVEHKTTSGAIDGVYFQRLEMDEQIPTYMLGANAREVIFDVCATPSIKQRKGETDAEFRKRCIEWFESGDKFQFVSIVKTDGELWEFMQMQDAVITEMENCKVYYRNPSHCMKWGRLCEYAPICMHFDPQQEYIQFKKRERKEEK